MPIHIKNIQVKNLGPIVDADYELGLVNLFFGKNESGKTYLTEFILSSLFKHAKKWQLRDFSPAGSISVSGLHPAPVLFSPSSTRKIEDHWADTEPGLPTNMARLLVVKGAEISLSKSAPGGVGREVLKNALTSHQVLDTIRGKIPATAQTAEITDFQITGKNQGKIKEKNLLAQSLSEINRLLTEVENGYTGGDLKRLEIKKNAILEELGQQQIAKQHQAYLLWNAHQKLLKDREKISDQLLFSLRDQIRDYKRTRDELADLKHRLNEIASSVDSYRWLTKAIDIWQSQGLERHKMPSLITLISGGALLLVGTGLLAALYLLPLPDLFWIGIIAILLGIGITAYYGSRYYHWSISPAETDERLSIQASFQKRFGIELKGLTELHHQRSQVEKDYHQSSLLQEEGSRLEAQLKPELDKINEAFHNLFGSTFPEEEWDQRLDDLFTQAKDLDQKSQAVLIDFTKLDVDQSSFQTTPTGTTFDVKRINLLNGSLKELNDQILIQESELEKLKDRACGLTKDNLSAPWPKILNNLKQVKQEITTSYKELIAELTAMIGLTSILDTLDAQEDQKIIQAINAEGITQILHRLTGKYRKIDLSGNHLLISDGKQEYTLQDLSTGARDQVQLALRLGMANHLSGGQPLFLVLDDAFQHSDWERRKKLVEEIAAIANQGWQIIYLSMDDHIRDLFQKTIKPAFKKDFKYFELS